MALDFSARQWDKVRDTYKKWWDFKCDRPVLPCVITGRDPGMPKPDAPLLSLTTSLELEIPADQIVDRIYYELCGRAYLGDAFPVFGMEVFGAGAMAAFLGARPSYSGGSIWFHPVKEQHITEMHFEYDPDNVWWLRVQEIYRSAMNRYGGEFVMGMTDLGGMIDILSTFRGAENLAMDMYDYPEDVSRLVWELHELWLRYFREINEIIAPYTPGYSDWTRLYSDVPYYTVQSDFSYMISADMFRQFVRDEIESSTNQIEHVIYHLDGQGQLAHLDMLLDMKNLNAVQWVPGDGAPPQAEWPEVYRKIQAAGKSMQFYDGFETIQKIAGQTGSYRGMQNIEMVFPMSEKANVQRYLSEMGAE